MNVLDFLNLGLVFIIENEIRDEMYSYNGKKSN